MQDVLLDKNIFDYESARISIIIQSSNLKNYIFQRFLKFFIIFGILVAARGDRVTR